MPVWLGALVGLPALLAAAKAHGRQVRLEREAAGYHSVQFGGENPAFVEALWRRDRVRYWSFVPPAAALLGIATWLLTHEWPRAVLAAALWAPTAGFFFAGLWAFAARRGEGGLGWWMGAGALAAGSVALSLA